MVAGFQLPLRLKIDGRWENFAIDTVMLDFGAGEVFFFSNMHNALNESMAAVAEEGRAIKAELVREFIQAGQNFWEAALGVEWTSVDLKNAIKEVRDEHVDRDVARGDGDAG